jgi:hypothetical protein
MEEKTERERIHAEGAESTEDTEKRNPRAQVQHLPLGHAKKIQERGEKEMGRVRAYEPTLINRGWGTLKYMCWLVQRKGKKKKREQERTRRLKDEERL